MLLASTVALAQERTPITLTPRVGQAIDPSGTYSGDVEGTVLTGPDMGVWDFGTWTIKLEKRDCLDCDRQEVGIFFAVGLMTYEDGAQEAGAGSGLFQPRLSLALVSFVMTNCSRINPGGRRYENTTVGLAGVSKAGQDGEVPGDRLTLDGDVLQGRISGRDCFNQTYSADVRLTRE